MSRSFNLAETDKLLTTTRAVRKRLDLARPVERQVLLDCIGISQQAPTASNTQLWRWILIQDADKKAAVAEVYGRGEKFLQQIQGELPDDAFQTKRVYNSAASLFDYLHKVPALVIPCVLGRPKDPGNHAMVTATYASILPAVWSFQLALRSRGLGSTLTTLHLMWEQEVAEILSIPDDVMQVALLPVAYTLGTEFKLATRPPPEEIVHWDQW